MHLTNPKHPKYTLSTWYRYFLCVTASTVGYGDFSPSSQPGQWIVVTFIVCGIAYVPNLCGVCCVVCVVCCVLCTVLLCGVWCVVCDVHWMVCAVCYVLRAVCGVSYIRPLLTHVVYTVLLPQVCGIVYVPNAAGEIVRLLTLTSPYAKV